MHADGSPLNRSQFTPMLENALVFKIPLAPVSYRGSNTFTRTRCVRGLWRSDVGKVVTESNNFESRLDPG